MTQMQTSKAAHEVASYFSCLDMGFESEVFIAHGEVWARDAREGGRPQIADAIHKRVAEARRECAAKSAAAPARFAPTTTPATPSRAAAAAMKPAELRAAVDQAYAAIAAESQANVDAMWADVVGKIKPTHARATVPASAVEQAGRTAAVAFPNAPAENLADSPRTATPRQAQAEVDAMYEGFAAKLNASLPAAAWLPPGALGARGGATWSE
jgi:hypothetical protein